MTAVHDKPFDSKVIKAIIGLGNPGARYVYTRHNIGFLWVEYIAQLSGAIWKSGPDCEWAIAVLNSHEILLVKPQTFMNSSGNVWPWISKKGIKPEEVLVVHDELEKKFGSFQVRLGGSARGHNGLRSLIGACGDAFWRLRLGVDRPDDKNQVHNYVLERFTVAQQQEFPTIFSAAKKQLFL